MTRTEIEETYAERELNDWGAIQAVWAPWYTCKGSPVRGSRYRGK